MLYSSDSDLNSAYAELCEAVGHLFLCFARLEGALSAVLKLHLAENIEGMDPHESIALTSAIYGSMRFSSAKDTINRITAAQGADKTIVKFLGTIFGQLGEIQKFRDRLAHQQTVAVHDDHKTDDGFWQVSDQTTSKDIKNIKIYVFDTSLVHAASADVVKATAVIAGRKQTKDLLSGLSLEPVSWRYKPSKLKLVDLGSLRSRQ